MLVSGFIDGKLLYLLEFSFSEGAFTHKLMVQLKKRFPYGDKAGEFLRSANFDYRDFIGSQTLSVVYCNKSMLHECKIFVVKGFYENLINLMEK